MRFDPMLIKRLVILAAALTGVVVLWRVSGLHELFFDAILFLEQVARDSGPAGALAFLALSVLAASIGPFTVVPLVPSALRAWGSPFTALMLMLGGLLGASLTYLIGRYAGERVLKLFVRTKRLERWKSDVPEHAAFLLAIAVKFALPAEIGYAFGMARFGLLKYLLVTFISYIPIIAAILWGSQAFVEGRLAPIVACVLVVAACSIAAGLYVRRVQERGTKK